MKRRKNLLLSVQAIARGEEIAAETGKTLSAVVEAQLLEIPSATARAEEFWAGPPLQPSKRPADVRFKYLNLKHG